jgi:O-antigen/teichoic acid export membrane protein
MTLMQLGQRARLYTFVSSVRLVVQLGLNVLLLVVLGWGVKGPLVATLVTNVIVGSVLTTWMLRQTGLAASWAMVVDLLRFGIPYRLARIGAFVLTFGDRYFLKAYHPLAVIGVYSLGYQFGFLLIVLTATPFMQAWGPQRFELVHAPRQVRDAQYNRGLLFFSLLVVAVGTAICVFVRPLLSLMSDAAFHGAIDLVPILVLAYAVQAWTDVVELGIQVSEKTRFAGYGSWISVAVVLVLYALLIPDHGALGAAVATLVAFVVRFVCYYAFSQSLWPVDYDWRPTGLMLGYGAACIAASQLWRPAGLAGQIVVGCSLYLVFLGLVWFGGALHPPERESIVRFARRQVQGLLGPRVA